jgi:putative FmdB family regulatory protein
MPTYTYRCTKCGDEIEVVQSMTDPPLKRCKQCRGALRRTFHPVGIVLKGSGFYKTDYASPAKSKSSSKSSESKSSESKSSDSKSSESKGSESKGSDSKSSGSKSDSATKKKSDD